MRSADIQKTSRTLALGFPTCIALQAKNSSCKDAIAVFEAKTGQKAIDSVRLEWRKCLPSTTCIPVSPCSHLTGHTRRIVTGARIIDLLAATNCKNGQCTQQSDQVPVRLSVCVLKVCLAAHLITMYVLVSPRACAENSPCPRIKSTRSFRSPHSVRFLTRQPVPSLVSSFS